MYTLKYCGSCAMNTTLLIAFVFELLCSTHGTFANNDTERKVLLILLDGFRWDYLNFTDLIGFTRIAEEGVQAEYMEALYPSESYPGYYSVATGLYGESHGMILNYMYDQAHNAISQMAPNNIADQSFWWEDAEPIWITTTRHNIDTAMMLWPGSATYIHGLRAKIYESYSTVHGVETFRSHLNKILELYSNNEIRYAQVYCELIDIIGHTYGPNSAFLQTAVRELDLVFHEFLNNITKRNLSEQLHFVIVSDHGMAATDFQSVNIVDINHVLRAEDVDIVLDRGSHMGIYPAEGKNVTAIIEKLKTLRGIDVYEKYEIPESYHFKNHRRVPPIYVVVRKGYFLLGLSGQKQYPPEGMSKIWNGFHGYDPVDEDMRGIFLAWGNVLKKGFLSPPIHITDPYNLLAHLLDLNPLPNNGSWFKMKALLDKNNSDIGFNIYSSVTSLKFFHSNVYFIFYIFCFVVVF